MRKSVSIFVLVTMALVTRAADLEAGHSAYVIHDGQALLADKDPDSEAVMNLKTHKEYQVVTISGKWVQLKAGDRTGWVYVGNVSRDEPPDVNTSSLSTESSDTTLNAAARGLDNDAKGYADRKDEAASANDVAWMEKQNDAVSRAEVKAYLKEHKLGEFQ